MKIIFTLITILFFTTPSFAADITEAEVKDFLHNWLNAQNTGSYSNYATMYSDNFIGIRRSGSSTYNLNHDAWLKDRKQMFKKRIAVNANNPIIQLSGATASIKFEQTWESGTYKDTGNKQLDLISDNGSIKIIREEMLSSRLIQNTSSENKIHNSKSKSPLIKKLIYLEISLKEKDCKSLPNKKSIMFDNRNLDRNECLAPKGWHLFTVIGGERYWIEIVKGNTIWSTENEVVLNNDYRFGNFQSIDFEKAEWLIKESGEPNSLIFPVVAQDPDSTDNNLNRFFIIKFIDKVPYFCGVAKTINEARKHAKNATTCNNKLSKRSFK